MNEKVSMKEANKMQKLNEKYNECKNWMKKINGEWMK